VNCYLDAVSAVVIVLGACFAALIFLIVLCAVIEIVLTSEFCLLPILLPESCAHFLRLLLCFGLRAGVILCDLLLHAVEFYEKCRNAFYEWNNRQ
jgi:hypothetical protein